jgi:putative membrane protein
MRPKRGLAALRSALRTRVPQICATLFVLALAASAWRPWFVQDWAMENLLTVLTSWWLVRHHRERPFSNLSYALLMLFAMAHLLGSHFTYSLTPYDQWFRGALGFSLDELFGATRNQYDRFVHFLFGLLCFLPVRELVRSRVTARGRHGYLLPGAIIVTIATFYELAEWWAMELFGGDLGQSYLGMQGDIWDAQKDVLVAVIGALLAGLATAWSAQRRQPSGVEPAAPQYQHLVHLSHISRHGAVALIRRLRQQARRGES